MSGDQKAANAAIGKALWGVEFMTDHIGDTGVHFTDGEGGDDKAHQAWADAIYENYQMLKGAVTDLKKAILQLPPEAAGEIAAAFSNEDRQSKARGAATCMLANIQREISEKKGGAA